MKKSDLIIQIITSFDEGMLEQCLLQYKTMDKHPWMRFRKADLEAVANEAKNNYYSLQLGCNMAWYPYISKRLRSAL